MDLRYFDFLSDEDRKKIFMKEPQLISRDSEKEFLEYSLGATLYIPATKSNIAESIISRKIKAKSIVICLEDAIGDNEVELAENMLEEHLRKIYLAVKNDRINYENLPLIFIRVRNPNQTINIVKKCGETLGLVTGFVFPKFTFSNGVDYFKKLELISQKFDKTFYGMPVLETEDVMNKETRQESLEKISGILNEYSDSVLNIRMGATDFSGMFGIRRGYDVTIYDIHVIRDCITDIINRFSRDKSNYVISGPVWEYFSSGERVLKPKLRITPFKEIYGNTGLDIRSKLVDKYIDGLINEVLLDRANGLIGKTVIHPSHIMPVQSLYVVTHEEYMDALNISQNNDGSVGVLKSAYSNKMNEIKPHTNWARKILKRAKIYGVYNANQDFVSLMKVQ